MNPANPALNNPTPHRRTSNAPINRMNRHDKSWEIARGEANQRNQRKEGVLRLLRIRAFYRLKINVKNAIVMKRTTLQNVEWDALTMAPKDEPSHGNEIPTASLCKSQ